MLLALAVIVLQLVPLFVLYSICTLLATVLASHVIVWLLPLLHTSPPLGTVSSGVGKLIVNTALLTSLFDGAPTLLILTNACVVTVFGIVQA